MMACSKCGEAGDHERCGAMMAARAALVGNFSLLDPGWRDDGGDACQWSGVVCTAVDDVAYRNVTKAPVVSVCPAGQGYSLSAGGCEACVGGTWNDGAGGAAMCLPWSVSACPAGERLVNGTNSSDSRCLSAVQTALCDLADVMCDLEGTVTGGGAEAM